MVKNANIFYKLTYAICWFVFKVFFRMEIRGEKIPREGGAIIAGNHTSYLDPIIMGLSVKRTVSFLGKEELFKIPVLSWVIRKLTTIPVKRGEPDLKSIKYVINLLKEGRLIGIFPEGTRRKTDGEVGGIFRGVGLISQKSGAPVYPISIKGANNVWKKRLIPLRFPKITVIIGKPILPEVAGDRNVQLRISKETMKVIKRNLV